MQDIINKLYRNHSLIYKALLFVCTTFFIVYLFPKSGKFKYNFERGKPWQSENLYAPFNFAVQKSEEEITEEKQYIIDHSIVYFNEDATVEKKVVDLFKVEFNRTFSDSLPRRIRDNLYNTGNEIISELYHFGVLTENYNYPDDRVVVILDGQVKKHNTEYSHLIKLDEVKSVIVKILSEHNLNAYESVLVSLFF